MRADNQPKLQHSRSHPTWRIIPVSKWLGRPPFIKGSLVANFRYTDFWVAGQE